MEEKNIAKMLFDQEMMRVDKDELIEAAKGLHTLYSSFIDAGFSKLEALHLVSTILSSGLGGGKR